MQSSKTTFHFKCHIIELVFFQLPSLTNVGSIAHSLFHEYESTLSYVCTAVYLAVV